MSYRNDTAAMYDNTAEAYFITADSFGSDLPANWEEIVAAMNEEIAEKFNEVLTARADLEAAQVETGDLLSEQATNADEALNDAAESFLYWLDDFWDHIFWDEHPEYRE